MRYKFDRFYFVALHKVGEKGFAKKTLPTWMILKTDKENPGCCSLKIFINTLVFFLCKLYHFTILTKFEVFLKDPAYTIEWVNL